ncbi:hypothetical protein GXM_04874 [Nostoc sphaeroides CCNUC1]|uniref:Uncharacterized protein n=1 Tax=Nostoc sphaeroides CCNUC1 TaxID=2653204 RepID=A0A5P8W3Z4_9NOSO|nr:hypothetical protein GXM_04874 [Nostoc sphaeroides CCNUC1]
MRESIHTRIVNYKAGATQLTVKNMPRGWVQKQWSYYLRACQK